MMDFLETHYVDQSLKEKLKCLVFIPIISRTYCDPKSFAWVNEFMAFVKQASEDQFGLKVKLPNGNIASRVLPVTIHDLDSDDTSTLRVGAGRFSQRHRVHLQGSGCEHDRLHLMMTRKQTLAKQGTVTRSTRWLWQ